MKKLFAVIFVFVILGSFVSAQIDIDSSSLNFKERTNELLAREIQLSDSAKFFVKSFFGVGQDSVIDFQTFVVLIELVILFLFLFHLIARIFLSNGISWLVSVAGIFVVSFFGVTRAVVNFLFAFSGLFSFLEDVSIREGQIFPLMRPR